MARHVWLLAAGARRCLWAASCALFLLLSSLFRVPDVPVDLLMIGKVAPH